MSVKFLKSPSFCVLPFIEHHQDIQGVENLCCHSSTPIDRSDHAAMKILLNKIYTGEQVPHCESCYKLDQSQTVSPRLLESVRWLRDPEVADYIENWTPDTTIKYFFYDLRYDNKCNLACISCNPTLSSLWAQELGVEITNAKNRVDLKDCLSAKKIYMAGGEPFVIEEFVNLIRLIAEQDQQPELVINTNLTKINDELKQTLSKIKKLTLMVSVDSFGSVNEYHRWPMRWPKFINNLEWARSIDCNISLTSVVDAVSVIGIHRLIEIEPLVDQWNLQILVGPSSLLLQNLPESIKSSVLSTLPDLKRSKFYNTDPAFNSRCNLIAEQLQQSGNPELLAEHIRNIDQRREINHYTYLGHQLT